MGSVAEEMRRPVEERAAEVDAYYIEPVVFLASIGELREDEIAELREAAEDARPRIGTDAEVYGFGGVDMIDRRRVKLWEAVRAALPGREAA